MAILSGVAANIVADAFGLVAPFMLAIVTFVVGGGVIAVSWSENYGQQSVRRAALAAGPGPRCGAALLTRPRSMCRQMLVSLSPGGELAHFAQHGHRGLPSRYGLRHARLQAGQPGLKDLAPDTRRPPACGCTDVKILSLGLIQSLFEGAMYSFVFMWTPALQRGLCTSTARLGRPRRA